MKICITSKGDNLESEVDPRFGRCSYFIIVDTETLAYEAIENPSKDSDSGAGVKAGELVVNKNVTAVYTGHVGPKAESVLKASNISFHTGSTGRVNEIIKNISN